MDNGNLLFFVKQDYFMPVHTLNLVDLMLCSILGYSRTLFHLAVYLLLSV